MLNSKVIQITIGHYLLLPLNSVEESIEGWLSEDWSSSPYRDLLTPYLILRKLQLNEEEY